MERNPLCAQVELMPVTTNWPGKETASGLISCSHDEPIRGCQNSIKMTMVIGAPVQGRPTCRVIGNPDSTEALGPVTLEHPPQGIPQIRTRMLLLPQRASLEYREVDASGGSIRFSGWGISSARVVETSLLRQKCATNGEVTSLDLAVDGGPRTPKWMTVELLWPHTTSLARIRLPVPADGVRVFDADEKELQSGHQIAIDNLVGVRIVLNRGIHLEKLTLNIEAVSRRLSRQYPLRILPGALSADVALIDYETDIQHLLSLNDSPDAEVVLSISSSHKQNIFNLRVARHAVVIERDMGQQTINAHGLDLDSTRYLASAGDQAGTSGG